MAKYYYLHLWTNAETDESSVFEDPVKHPNVVNNLGLLLNDWYKDEVFDAYQIIISTEKIRSLMSYEAFQNINFSSINRIEKGLDFQDNYPDAVLGKLWRIECSGVCGVDDFALWKGLYLVVSDRALEFLRDNGVTHAESDEITVSFEDYFESDRKDFWM